MDILNSQNITLILGIFLALYGANAGLELPEFVANLFKDDIFRVLFLSLLLIFRFENAPHVAFIVALIFVITLQNLGDKEMREKLTKLSRKYFPRVSDVV